MNGIFIHQQVKAFIDLGHQCHVLLPHKWFPPFGLHKFHPYWKEGYQLKLDFFTSYEGIEILPVPVFVKMPDRIFSEDPYEREAVALFRFIKSHPHLTHADYIISHFLTETSFVAQKLSKMLHIPYAAFARGDDVHDWPIHNPKLKEQVNQVYFGASKLFANSIRLAEDTHQLVKPEFKRTINVIYNGVDLTKFFPISAVAKKAKKKQIGFSLDKYQVLCVATPVKLKGWMELLDSLVLNQKLKSTVELIAVAVTREFPDRIDLQKEANKRGVNIKLLGQINHEDLVEVYQASDLFVLPSYNEGLANVALEAAASNLPMVLTKVGGHEEVFRNSNFVALIQPKDIEALSASISKMLDRNDLELSDTRKIVEKNVGDYLSNAKKLIEELQHG
jgi:teichuronic acid biosynthesis glycosyltransferase TuaC